MRILIWTTRAWCSCVKLAPYSFPIALAAEFSGRRTGWICPRGKRWWRTAGTWPELAAGTGCPTFRLGRSWRMSLCRKRWNFPRMGGCWLRRSLWVNCRWLCRPWRRLLCRRSLLHQSTSRSSHHFSPSAAHHLLRGFRWALRPRRLARHPLVHHR